MAKCHNCGRETLRTQDWACQWCGYPLISPVFGKIDKTYRQLKEERLCQAEAGEGVDIPAEEETMAAVAIVEEIVQEVVAIEEEPALQTEAEAEPLVEETEEEEICQAIEEEVKEEPEAADADECETAAEAEVEVEEAIEEEEKPTAEMEVETEAEPEIEPESEPELQTPDEEIDVVEIFKAYDSDDAAADERFGDKVIRITGTLSLIDVKDVNDMHYIRLTGSTGDLTQSLKCLFDKKHGPVLCRLEKGQVVTVQGRYNGSIIAMRMLDCSLVC